MRPKAIVGIIGGGIGGVALANALMQRGIEFRLFEKAKAFGEVGAGVQMTPNAVKVLRALGVGEDLASVSFKPKAIVGRNWSSAREAFRTPLIDECPRLYGADFLHVHRADLHDILARRVPIDSVRLGVQCVGVRNEGGRAIASFDDGTEFVADILVGADGVRSVVRDQMFGDSKPQFTGHMCWRAVVPVDKHPFSFVSPDSSFWLGPKGHIVTYYVRKGAAVNIVAVNETADWVEESWNVPSSRAELLKAFEGWHPNLIELLSRVDETFKWGLFDRDPMQTWNRGRITLLGDAAHPMLPFLSQGAAMAIEDGYVLAKALSRHPDSVETALVEYENERLPRTSRVQLEARERGRTYHLPSRWQQIKRDAMYWWKALFNPHESGLQANWVYAYDATTYEERLDPLEARKAA